ncbi:MAG TPA: UDP-N-acetylmuramate dehydrogenase [Terracidiphilus sp.]|jgi:UDP-N-acetylmuramate dehydrogenase|nr:UDP-N-acetylmuramate dehydrogenase [Terracidiphilus sp.]
MRIEENKALAPLTTLGIGGPARWFARAASERDVAEAVQWARVQRVPLFILGGGSNLLVADHGFEGLVLQVALEGIARTQDGGAPLYQVAAGEPWDRFVQRAVDDDCAGIECLAGIPGTVGGTPVQNVGAYGQEVASTIACVRAFDCSIENFVEFSNAECGFGYRRSRFNTTDRDRFIVTRVDYRLTSGGAPTLRYAELQRMFAGAPQPRLTEVAEAVRRIRETKGMLLVEGDANCRSAGSFFKNPVVTEEQAGRIAVVASQAPPRFPAGSEVASGVKIPAAWLIEQAGFAKGYARGTAAISSRHTLALINRGGATAAEIVALADEVRDAVELRFGIRLEREPVLLGFAD